MINKIDKYLKEDKLNEGYHTTQFGYAYNDLEDWIEDMATVAENEGKVKDGRYVLSILKDIQKNYKDIDNKLIVLKKFMKQFTNPY
jgi:mannitol/fructose-specific phosphotransferase system IIA component (Ntr-type)